MPLLIRRVLIVSSSVISSVSNLKVFYSIISTIFVDMMNYLVRTKLSAQVYFNDLSIAGSSMLPIRMVFRVFILKYLLTFSRAKNMFTPFMAFIVSKSFFTFITVEYPTSKLVITAPITEPRFLRRGSVVCSIAMFTNMFHPISIAVNAFRYNL